MNEFDPRAILNRAFNSLHQEGFNLGVGEYLAALDAVEGGWGTKNIEDLKQLVRLLWCSSVAEQNRLQMVWEQIITRSKPKPKIERPQKERQVSPPQYEEKPQPPPEVKLEQVETQPIPELAPQPVQAPFLLAEVEEDTQFENYWPVSHRQMVYSWRYLRRLVADGVEDVLDVTSTVEQVAKQGFFLQAVYRRRETNHAHLLLLIDQEGSMTPFHRFTRDLVETAKYESNIERMDVGYFHNIPAESIYQDSHLTQPIPLNNVLAQCDSETKVFIVSDGGAARGYRRMERVRAITEVLLDIKQYTKLIAWLNPMPKDRWESTSAQILSYLVPMFPMSQEGLFQAVNIVRSQIWQQNL
ncbi:MAG: VWA containing CoxE family protein [Xenococcus sp. (in: cyanobacteria)]